MRRPLLLLLSLASLLAPQAAQARTLYGTEAEVHIAQQVVSQAASQSATSVVLPMAHLPGWVQVVNGSGARLYTADTGTALVADARIKRYTFLRVLGGGLSRLKVDAYGDSGRAVLSGWVEADSVAPSAPGTNWLVTAGPTALFRSVDTNEPARVLAPFSPLQATADPTGGRVLVRVYNADFTPSDQGWVQTDATGPALAPATRVASDEGSLAMRSLRNPPSATAFLAAASDAALVGARATGVPASVTVAQAILESDWGRSSLSQDAQNYFGMKVMGTLGNDGAVWLPTSEYDADGNLYRTVAAFRAYKSLTDSLLDHDQLLQLAGRYATAMRAAGDPRQFAVELYQAGYSTDPEYPDKLVALMDAYNLYRLDA